MVRKKTSNFDELDSDLQEHAETLYSELLGNVLDLEVKPADRRAVLQHVVERLTEHLEDFES